MMMRYISHKQIDKAHWDECIKNAKNAILYAYSWYLDIVSPGWEALILGDYKAVFPLCRKKKFGFQYLCQPPFSQQLGIFSGQEDDPKLNAEFLHSIPKEFKLVEINLNISNALPGSTTFSRKQGITYHLDLSADYGHIASNYSENLIRNLKKASKSSFELIPDPAPGDIIELFRKNRGRHIENLGNKEFEMLKKIIDACGKNEKIKSYGVKLAGEKLTAGMIVPESDGQSIFLFSALSENGKSAGAMPFLIDQYIRHNAGRKICFDFEGSNNKNIARFYSGFGSKEYVYLQLKKNELPFYIRPFKN
jgi:hypothetical protein